MALSTLQIQQAYVAFFNRPADLAGLNFWSTGDQSQQTMFDQFAASAEYTANYAGLSNMEIVNKIYVNLFGHDADLPGLLWWTAGLDAGRETVAGIAYNIGVVGAQGTDDVAFNSKVTAATAFTDALDTTPEVMAYAGATGPAAGAVYIASVTDVASLDAAVAGLDATLVAMVAVANPPVGGLTLPLTTGVDTGAAFTGGSGDDTFNASGTTLTSGDSLTGGLGTDTLNIVTTVAAGASLGAGVQATGIEVLSFTATPVLGNVTLAATGFTGVTTVTNVGSTANVTVTGLAAIPVINVTGTSMNTTVTAADAAIVGLANPVTINLNGVGTTAASNPTIAVAGVETINVASTGTASGAATSTVTVSGGANLATLAVTGSAAAKLAVTLGGATATTTGTVTSDAGAVDVAITADATDKLDISMGDGNDTVRIANIAATHTIDGGAGNGDTLVSSAAITTTTGAHISGFEAVSVDAVSVALPTALNTVNAVTFTSTGGTFAGIATGGTITQAAAGSNTVSNTAWTAATDSLTYNVGSATVAGAFTAGLTANLIETATINNVQLSTGAGTRTLSVTGDTLKTLNVVSAGLEAVAIGGGGTALTTIDASGVAGAVTITATVATAGATLTGGAGNDVLAGGAGIDSLTGNAGDDTLTGGTGNDTVSGGAGADSITGGVGADQLTGGDGADIFVFGTNETGAVVSNATTMDTITDFKSLTDRLQVAQTNDAFVGNVANIQLGLAAMTAVNQSFFVTGENTLYVVATKGALSNTDTIIKMTDVTGLVAADVGTGSQTGGSDVTLSNVGGTSVADVTLTASTLDAVTTGFTASTLKTTTGFNDTVRADAIQLDAKAGPAYTTLTGGNGSDTLALYGGNAGGDGTTALEMSLVTSFETISLNETSVSGGTTTDFSLFIDDANAPAAQTTTITGASVSTAAVWVDASAVAGTTSALSITGGSYALGAGDSLKGGAGNDSINGGAGNDTIDGGSGNDTLIGGTGNDQITASNTDSVDAGAGDDTVIVGGTLGTSTTVLASIEMGSGTNTLSLTNGANLKWTTVAATGGTYNILLASGAAVTMSPSQFTGAGTVTGDTTNAITFSTNGTVNVSASDIDSFTLDDGTAGTGANTITVDAVQTSITGADGNDTVIMASTEAVTVLAGTVALGAGAADAIQVTGTGASTVTLSANVTGVETISYAATTGNVSLITNDANVAASSTLTVTASSQTSGTFNFNGSDESVSTSAYVVTTSSTGLVTIIGGAGNDSITATGAGTHTLTGGGGVDTITGGTVVDVIDGGAGNDVIVAGTGVDSVSGGAGADTITLNAAGTTITQADHLVMALTDTGTVPFGTTATTGTLPALNVPVSTLNLDIVNGFSTASFIDIAAGSGNFGTATLLRSPGQGMISGSQALIQGDYSSSAGTFTISNTGLSSMYVYDADTGANVEYRAVVLVGFVDPGTDTGGATGLTGTA